MKNLIATRLVAALSIGVSGTIALANTDERPCATTEYAHGISNLLPLKYGPDFTHFEWVNPDAPNGGTMRMAQLGMFDNYNSILEKGRLPEGYERYGGIVYDSLLEPAIDETGSYYGRLAEGVDVAPDFSWIAFKLRDNAYWHDGEPITVEDVLYTYEIFQKYGSVSHRTTMLDVDRVFAFGEREVCFVVKQGAEPNTTLAFAIGNYAVYPKHYWETRDVSTTAIKPPLGSGPYEVSRHELGRVLVYQRRKDYWARDIPLNKGRYNFDRLKFDYFRDDRVMMEAHRGDVYDVAHARIAKDWATNYEFPAVKAGLFIRELKPMSRVEGLWWPVFWNMDQPKLQDIRVREALQVLFDFSWTNRVVFHGYYAMGVSFFQNSPMAHSGLPGEKELELLEPFRDQLPPRVFTEEYRQPPSTGFGPQRAKIERALKLFQEAGWELQAGAMRSVETGERFTLRLIGMSHTSIQQNLTLVQNLSRIGIETTSRKSDITEWLHRSRTGKFDGNSFSRIPSHLPGLQLRNWFGSAAAGQDFALNWSRIRDPVVDYLINKTIAAKTAEDLYAATRALDRVLLWSFYFIPIGSQPGYRLVYWDRFGQVKTGPLLRVPFMDAWWWEEEKARHVEEGIAKLQLGG